MESTLKSEALEALGNIFDIVVPEFNLFGYNKQKFIKTMLEAAQKEPLMTKLRLHLIYTELRKLADNGGLL